MHIVQFEGKTRARRNVTERRPFLAASVKASVPLPHTCGGHARCGTCLVTVQAGAENLSEMGAAETRVLRALKANPDQRLACQTGPGDVA